MFAIRLALLLQLNSPTLHQMTFMIVANLEIRQLNIIFTFLGAAIAKDRDILFCVVAILAGILRVYC